MENNTIINNIRIDSVFHVLTTVNLLLPHPLLYTFHLIPDVLKITRIKLLFETIPRYHANIEMSEKKISHTLLESL